MEWVLQVVDEFDDWIGALRFKAECIGMELGQLLGGLSIVAVFLAAAWNGANALVLTTALGTLGCAAILKTRRLVLPTFRSPS